MDHHRVFDQEMSELKEKSAGMKSQWQSEKAAIGELQAARAEVDELRTEVDLATRRGDLQKAAELRYGRIPQLEATLQAQEARLQEVQRNAR